MLPAQIKGLSGSRGVVTGTAKVILKLADAAKLKPGNILVTKATSPLWTPFIHVASAIVTDIGGTLSHAAIVSREYGIPAVVGTKIATKKIKSGQTITVDGNNGLVTY